MSSTNPTLSYIAKLQYISGQLSLYMSIIILVFGLIGNLLNCLVFAQRSLRSKPCVVYFLVASILNLIIIFSGIAPRAFQIFFMIPDQTETVSTLFGKPTSYKMFHNNSIVVDENLSPDDPLFWSRPTSINCNIVRIIGIFLCLAAFIGIVLNGALLYSFVRYKFLRTPPNIFIMFISGIGLLASCSIIPLAGSSSLYCYWLYGRVGCQVEAIMAFLYGCSSSYLLCAVSLSRCYIIVRPFNAKSVSIGKCIIIASVVVIIAFIWTMLPIIGWNEYTLEVGTFVFDLFRWMKIIKNTFIT
ncbi:unnamed protein product [Rotaria sp. Silwood1]|nr:unnamed protein product [Rotaria sp. Silwood1]